MAVRNSVRIENQLSNDRLFPESSKLSGYSVVVFASLIVIYCVLRSLYLTDFSLWADEIFSLKTARLPWGEMFNTVAADQVHPPLFYIMLKLWISVGGDSLLWLKLLPFAISIVSIFPFYKLSREIGLSAFAMNSSLALIAVNAFMIFFSQELRAYSLLACMTLFSLFFFARFLNADLRLNLFLLFVCNLALVYTHYFGWLVIASEGLFLICCRRRKLSSFLVQGISLVIAFSPWLYLLNISISEDSTPFSGVDWIDQPGFSDLLDFFGTLAGSKAAGLALLAAGLWYGIRRILPGKSVDLRGDRYVLWLLKIAFFTPTSVVFLISAFGPRSFWVTRYLIIVAPPLALLGGFVFDNLKAYKLGKLLLIIALASSLHNSIRKMGNGNDLSRAHWEGIVNHLIHAEQSEQGGIKVFQFESVVNEPIKFYVSESKDNRFEASIVDSANTIEDKHFWLVFRENRERKRGNFPKDTLVKKGYSIYDDAQFGSEDERINVISFGR